jgi:PAS domain S-box-containing protein
MLRVLPQTTNVAVVLGHSALERFWLAELRRQLQPFTNRVSLVWYHDLSFGEMLRRCAVLPPHSAIFYVLLAVDADGVPHLEERALARLHQVATAPIFGLHDTQLGRGIVGGPLMAIEGMSRNTAQAAVRILSGEVPGNVKTPVQEPGSPQFDWRELRRWGINETRLPPGSVVLFRQPNVWELYKRRLVAVALVSLAEAVLIGLLVGNLVKRRRVEQALRESEERLNVAAAAANVGVWMWDIVRNEIWGTADWRRMFGLPGHAAIRLETVMERIHPDDRARVKGAVQRALEARDDYIGEFRVALPEGGQRWLAARGRVFVEAGGKPQRMLGASVDISARKQAEEAARGLSGRLIGAQEAERARLAKELHDGLSQNLALLAVELDVFGQRLPGASEQLHARLQEFSAQAKGLSAEVHRLSHGLHPAKLTQLGLAVALKSYCREVESAHQVAVCFEARDVPRELPEDVALCLYRVAQEAIQNAIKHSAAETATVNLGVKNNTIELEIADPGKGFEVGAARNTNTLGLVSMAERVRLVHGEIVVESNPGQGTRVRVRVPLPKGNIP